MGQLHAQVTETEGRTEGQDLRKCLGCLERTQENPLIRDMTKTQQNGLTELDQRCRVSQGEKRAGAAGFHVHRRLPTITYLDGRQVLEVAVRMWDQAWRAVPLASRVNPDLTFLVSGQELGSIGTEVSWQSEKPLSSRDPRWALSWPAGAPPSHCFLEMGGRGMIWAVNKHPRGSAAGGAARDRRARDLGLADAVRG